MADDWRRRAACRAAPDKTIFYPEKGQTRTTPEAKRWCGACPVRGQCLEVGMRERFGIWGGLTERERRIARKAGMVPVMVALRGTG